MPRGARLMGPRNSRVKSKATGRCIMIYSFNLGTRRVLRADKIAGWHSAEETLTMRTTAAMPIPRPAPHLWRAVATG